jgi:TusA-related sulfurtransferase
MKIIERTHNAETGEIIDVERDMTKAETDFVAAAKAERLAIAEAEATKAAQKAAVLAKLGLTADEVAALLS